MNLKNSEASDPHRVFDNFSGKTDLKRSNRYIIISKLSI